MLVPRSLRLAQVLASPRSWLVWGVVGALASCSFTTAGNFKECESDVDCGSLSACSQSYCLTLPAGCRREEAGGAVKAFSTADRIPIAALLPLTNLAGVADDSEQQGLNAMRLAVSEVNDRNGLKNRSFGLFVCNTSRDKDITATQTAWMIDNLKVPAILTSGTGQTQDITKHPARIDAGTMIISATATGPTLISTYQTEGNVWRVAPPDTKQAQVMANLIKADFPDAGGTRVDIVYEFTDYGSGLANPLKEALVGAGYTNDLRQFDPQVPSTQTPVINGLSNDTPKAAVLIVYPSEARDLVSRARTVPALTRANGFRWYLVDAAKDPAILRNEDGGVAVTMTELDQALGTAPAQGAGGAFASFRDSFRTRYGTDPNSFSYTSHSYDAMWLVMLASAFAQSTNELSGPRLREGMGKLSAAQASIPVRVDKWTEASNLLLGGQSINVEGASGPLDFDLDAGVPGAPHEVWQISDGGIRVLRLTNP